ncbi:DUF2680 domain-containing protein [Paenibacillus hexagrammi]|uniref:DUF2680 domain-containing protein n=1 Tax=Paenibacillus hexagrammi TaxID=2908839 RepID=A0ABY3SNC8_9BACL|nr:DUF2680 domain-containing protein [Paenibacillus sp. YPD9-1]UJF35224.1 DUF2680 domain-containing protein [Paenibacillus sp. YPD9-1]
MKPMKLPLWKKLGVSSVALTMLLSAGSLSMGSLPVHAAAEDTSSVQAGSESQGVHKHGHKWPIIEESASLIGVNKETMVKSLQNGKSIVDVASEKGVSEADLTAKLMKLRTSKIDVAVKEGKLSSEQGEKLKQRLDQHLKQILNEKNLLEKMKERGAWKKHGHGLRPDTAQLAQSLGMTQEELRAQRKAGKSLAEIAQSKGMSKDKLIETIKEQLTPSIEKMVDRKKDGKKE